MYWWQPIVNQLQHDQMNSLDQSTIMSWCMSLWMKMYKMSSQSIRWTIKIHFNLLWHNITQSLTSYHILKDHSHQSTSLIMHGLLLNYHVDTKVANYNMLKPRHWLINFIHSAKIHTEPMFPLNYYLVNSEFALPLASCNMIKWTLFPLYHIWWSVLHIWKTYPE